VRIAFTRNQRQRARLRDEIVRLARADLDAVSEDIAALEAEIDTAHGPARDAYYAAVALHRDAESKLRVAVTLDDLRAAARLSGRARVQIAAARAWLVGDEPSPVTSLCFFDPAHGPAPRLAAFAPEGGAMRQLPACDACAEEVDAGRAPPMRRVMVNGYPQPYWRSPAHAGYYGYRSGSLGDLLSIASGTGAELELFDDVACGVLGALIDAVHPFR
jgi:hypothetical protein